MRFSRLFGRTLRETPSEVESPGRQWLFRAGMMRRMGQGGGFEAYLPLAQRVLVKLQQRVQAELESLGGQSVLLPMGAPLEASSASDSLCMSARLGEREWTLAPSGESTVLRLVEQEVRSYRQLPLFLYQFAPGIEVDTSGRNVRLRHGYFQRGYSFHASRDEMEQFWEQVAHAYQRVLEGWAIPVRRAEIEDFPAIHAEGWIHLTGSGEKRLLCCPQCGFLAQAEVARFDKGHFEHGSPLPVEEVATPGQTTIESVARFVGVPTHQTLKAVFYQAGDALVFVAIRGDLEMSEAKLARVLQTSDLARAEDALLRERGLVPGYASPVGVRDVTVIVDDSVPGCTNLVAGANREGYHLRNVNYGRDFRADQVADVALAREGAACADCGSPLQLGRGRTLATFAILGDAKSRSLKTMYLDAQGRPAFFQMGRFTLDLDRVLESMAEVHRDERGLVWSPEVAPYQIYLLTIGRAAAVHAQADALYRSWTQIGYEVLYDDRDESPGVKFNDADLLGIPLRVTVSGRTLAQHAVELKRRGEKEKHTVPLTDLNLDEWLRRPPEASAPLSD